RLTPLVPMHTLGHDFVPAPIHAGGLRYHGAAPLVSQLVRDGLVRAEAYVQNDVFASAVLFAGAEGIVPAPESAHAIHGALETARAADAAGTERTILFNPAAHAFSKCPAKHISRGEMSEAPSIESAKLDWVLQGTGGLPP